LLRKPPISLWRRKTMADKNYSGRALAAYYHTMAQHKPADLPIDDLPTRICEETIAERAYVIMDNGSRTLAVYRVKPGGLLRRLKRWPKAFKGRQGV